MKALLDRWEAQTWVPGNCVDSSFLDMIAICSIGIDFSCRRLTGGLNENDQLITNLICPIGNEPTNYPNGYITMDWAWHQVTIPTDEPFSPFARIWSPNEAHFKNLAGNTYKNPPAHHPGAGHLWPQKSYWQKPSFNGFLGLVNLPVQSANAPYFYFFEGKCQVKTGHWNPPG